METDFLVIGSGIAGLTYALKVAHHYPDKKVTILTKATPDETNTKYAQGGIAVVNDLENDSFEKHIEDTLIAGDGLCNREVVEIVVKEGPARVQEIIDWGANFDKDAEGDYKLGREGAIRNSGFFTIRILRVRKWKERFLKRSAALQILKLYTIVL
jgi:L-aspartate oxidase